MNSPIPSRTTSLMPPRTLTSPCAKIDRALRPHAHVPSAHGSVRSRACAAILETEPPKARRVCAML